MRQKYTKYLPMAESIQVQEKTTRDLFICGVTGFIFGVGFGAPLSIGAFLIWKKLGVNGASRWWLWGVTGLVVTPVMLSLLAQKGKDVRQGVSTVPQVTARSERKSDEPMLTLAKFGQIQTGMSYDEVVAIIGNNGVEQSTSEVGNIRTVMVSWANPGLMQGNASIIFQNGKLMSKSQLGLK